MDIQALIGEFILGYQPPFLMTGPHQNCYFFKCQLPGDLKADSPVGARDQSDAFDRFLHWSILPIAALLRTRVRFFAGIAFCFSHISLCIQCVVPQIY